MRSGIYRDKAIVTVALLGIELLWMCVVRQGPIGFLAQVHDGDTVYAEAEFSSASKRGSKSRYQVRTYAGEKSAPLKTSRETWHSDDAKALRALERAGIAAFEPHYEDRKRAALFGARTA